MTPFRSFHVRAGPLKTEPASLAPRPLRSLFALRSSLLVVLLVAWPTCGGADVVKSKDGRTFDGKIIEENNQRVRLRTLTGEVTVQRFMVVEIVRQKSIVDEVEVKLAALNPGDPEKYLGMAKYVLTDLKADTLGLRLLQLAVVLGARNAGEALLCLGDYYAEKGNRRKAAEAYRGAMLVNPGDPTCNQKFDSVKDAILDPARLNDMRLSEAIHLVQSGRVDLALDPLYYAKQSQLRGECEKILTVTLDQLVVYCTAKAGCRHCKGTNAMACPTCGGKGETPCRLCDGTGQRGKALCPACEGWGSVLCAACQARRNVIPDEKDPSFRAPRPAPEEDGVTLRPRYTLQNKKVACPYCKAPSPDIPTVLPDPVRLQACCDFLDKRLGGGNNFVEQAETRLSRVSGTGGIEGGKDLLEHPVFWDGVWVSVEKRRKVDPSFKMARPSNEKDIKKTAIRIAVEGTDPEAFEAKVRSTLALGVTTAAGQRLGYVVELPLRKRPAEEETTGPWAELSAAGDSLVAGLGQVNHPCSLRKLTLAGQASEAIPLAAKVAAGSTPAAMRVYFFVTDTREDISPSGDRDVCLTRLIVDVRLVETLDSTGTVLQSIR